MKKILLMMLSLLMMALTGCGGSEQGASDVETKTADVQSASLETAQAAPKSKILVAYFSHTGENYQVGWIEKGNTAIVADMIASKVGAEEFEIVPVNPYPTNYKECTEVAKTELESDARPAYVGSIDLSSYDVIFLGYPIWWGDMPPIVYTFLENNNFNGKTIIPFCTSAGNGMTGKETYIPQLAKGSTLKDGFGVEGKLAQENPNAVRPQVEQWLKAIGY